MIYKIATDLKKPWLYVSYCFSIGTRDKQTIFEEVYMAVSQSLNGTELVIQITGKFDFSAHQEFRNSYESLSPKPESYVIDMRDTTYLDSSALGMLLLLRDYAGGENSKIKLVNCASEAKKILSISNFEQLFEIS